MTQGTKFYSETRKKIAHDVVAEILDKDLLNSTWADVYPGAYENLKQYREDIEGSVLDVLERHDA